MYATSIGQDELGQLETGIGSNRGFDGSLTLVLPTETFDSLHLIISMIPKIPEYLYTLLEVQKLLEALGSKTINATWRNALKIDGDTSLIQKVTANIEKENPDFEVANK